MPKDARMRQSTVPESVRQIGKQCRNNGVTRCRIKEKACRCTGKTEHGPFRPIIMNLGNKKLPTPYYCRSKGRELSWYHPNSLQLFRSSLIGRQKATLITELIRLHLLFVRYNISGALKNTVRHRFAPTTGSLKTFRIFVPSSVLRD